MVILEKISTRNYRNYLRLGFDTSLIFFMKYKKNKDCKIEYVVTMLLRRFVYDLTNIIGKEKLGMLFY